MSWSTIITGLQLLVQLLGWLQSRGYIEQGRQEERSRQMALILQDIAKATNVVAKVEVMTDEEINREIEARGWYRE